MPEPLTVTTPTIEAMDLPLASDKARLHSASDQPLLLKRSAKNPATPIKASELGSGTAATEKVKLPARSAPAPDVPAPIKSEVKVPLICTEPYAERAPDDGGVIEGSVVSKVVGLLSKTVAPEIAKPSPPEPLPLSRVRLVNPGVKVKLNTAESKLAT